MSEWKECRLGDVAEVQTGPFGSQLYDVEVKRLVSFKRLGKK